MNNLTYITYQTFPADTANSLQSIGMIKNFIRNQYNVRLVFPNRSSESNDDIQKLQQYYSFKEFFEIDMLKHNLPFNDNKKVHFKRLRFHISHFIWSRRAVFHILNNERPEERYFTRSDWIFLFLTKKGKNVIFECHQLSKIRKWIIKYTQNKKNAKIIFTNKLLLEDLKISKKFLNNIKILENGFDEDFFFPKKDIVKVENSVIFVGKLLRFGKDRNIEFLIKAFKDPRLKNYTLNIIGGPNSRKSELIAKLNYENIHNIFLYGQLDRQKSIDKILESKVGILINSDDNLHSTRYTSPLKYYEYLRGGLNVVASNFPAHMNLSYSDYIYFFENNDLNSFIDSIILANANKSKNLNLQNFTLQNRTKNILKLFARPEGLEPPTF